MFTLPFTAKAKEQRAKLQALDKSQAIIEFAPDGTILDANENFLNALGYPLEEIKGKHHRMFVEPGHAKSPAYQAFWDSLARGEFQTAEYKRFGKGGREVWIQASYNPLTGSDGKVYKIVKYAGFAGQVDAIDRSQAMIEFNLDGTIINANKNFLEAVGYSLDEVQGKHHSIFVDPAERGTMEYQHFWEKLRRGEFQASEYRRIGKNGREIWIQATYNPIRNLQGDLVKVVKFASDITLQKMSGADYSGQIDAISKSQAVIEFNMDGTITKANENFLKTVGYSLDEIQGKHHSMFLEPGEKESAAYLQFWEALNRGQYQAAEYKRIGKGGREVWIQASYNPIMDLNGKPVKVVKYATEVTRQKLMNADFSGQIDAIGKSQAVIEFNMDGTIIHANENFLNAVGYTLQEIKGRHHSIFVDPATKNSMEYQLFWDSLRNGEYQTAEYRRLGKGGKEIWIQATYNPILDLNGKPMKVVKFATDITQQKLQSADYAGQIEAIVKSQAVIEFNMDGTILFANENFLAAMGYTLDEIKGRHHSIFLDNEYKSSMEYKQFWEALNRGEYRQQEFKRLAKGNKDIWIQASYNPIIDPNGKPYKVVKYASDITQMVQNRTENERFMKEAVNVLTEMATGNLTQKMEEEYTGNFNDIKTAVNATVDTLIGIVLNIKQLALAVNTAANEIAAGSTDLSMRTEQQASSLEETAASMEEITGTVKENSSNARTANDLTTKASVIADAGGKVVNEAVESMGNIEKSSKKISDIIGVIDEIAFQTNLLALNAAVEAARAGEAGKGFAVVASEVRSLAGRSASASKEIKALILESAGQVKSGAELVNHAGGTLKEIVTSVKEVAQIMAAIATASAEQSTGIDEINSAISSMDEVTQQNAALVEQNTAAGQSLLDQAAELDNLMRFFKTEEDEEAAPGIHFQAKPVKKPVMVKKPVASRPAPRPAPAPAKKLAGTNGRASHAAQDDWQEF